MPAPISKSNYNLARVDYINNIIYQGELKKKERQYL